MKILLCAEGPNDLGRETWNKRRKQKAHTEGWLHALVKRCNSTECEDIPIDFDEPVSSTKEFSIPKRNHNNTPDLQAKAAHRMQMASLRGCDLIIFHVDADSQDSTNEGKWRERREQIKAGFKAAGNKPPGIICVTKSVSESWLLADPGAWEKLGCKIAEEIPYHPEDMWGKPHDPLSNHPKMFFERLCKSINRGRGGAETRVELIEHMNLNDAQKRCPESLALFIKHLCYHIQKFETHKSNLPSIPKNST